MLGGVLGLDVVLSGGISGCSWRYERSTLEPFGLRTYLFLPVWFTMLEESFFLLDSCS